ncbi:MAG: hypothetical protein H8E28_02640 [Anaerolineae bacterium]|nr:hypothetical protein [Anaerolineae bacterium]
MEKHNKVSPRENRPPQYLSWLALTGLCTVLGYQFSEFLPELVQRYAIYSIWLFLIALRILKTDKPWNWIMLLGLSLTAGASLASITTALHWLSWSSLALSAFLAFLWAYGLGIRLRWLRVILYPAILLYLLGWIAFYFIPMPEQVDLLWIMVGVGLFLIAVVVSTIEARFASITDAPVPIASDLYILYFNLFWLGALLGEKLL